MSQSLLQRRLVDVSERLKRMRAELAVTEEQLRFLEEEAENVRLRALVAETPLADVVILDIKMPGLDGLSAARQIATDRLAAVLMITAFSQRELVEQARDAGALAYLVKPFQKSDLIPAIEVALGRYAELSALERDVEDLQARLDPRKTIDLLNGRPMDAQGH